VVFGEGAALVFLKGDLQFFFGVHDDGSVPGNGFADGLARDEEDPRDLGFGGDSELLAVGEAEQQIGGDRLLRGSMGSEIDSK